MTPSCNWPAVDLQYDIQKNATTIKKQTQLKPFNTLLLLPCTARYMHYMLLTFTILLHSVCSPLCTIWDMVMPTKSVDSYYALLVLDTSFTSLFQKTPTLLWVTPYLGLDTPTGMEFLCLLGIVLSLVFLVSQRCRDCSGFLALWFLYYSMLPVSSARVILK